MRRFLTLMAIATVGYWAVEVTTSPNAGAGLTSASSGGGVVTVGASNSGSSGGSSGSSGSSTSGSGSGGSSGSSGGDAPICTTTPLTLNDAVGPPPGATTPGGWYSIICEYSSGATTTVNIWISSASPTPTATTPAVNPITVAEQAEDSLRLPDPTLYSNPAGTAVVNLPTWLWINGSIWHSYSVSATVGSVTATATADPESVIWTTGDGSSITCNGPGTAYQPALTSPEQSTTCSHTYTESSAGEPSVDGDPDQGAFPVSATVDWSVSWTSEGAPGGGSLPKITTSSHSSIRVMQVESVNS